VQFASLHAEPPPPRPYHVTHYDVAVEPDFVKHVIFGAVTISFVARTNGLSHIELDAAETTIVGCSQAKLHLRYLVAGDILRVDLPRPLHAGQHSDIRIAYRATPTRGVAFFPDQIYTAFATSHWLPSNDRPDDRATFRLVVVAPEQFQVVASGALFQNAVHDGQRTWEWREERPIPTFVFGFAAGLFRVESRRAGKVELRLAFPAAPPVSEPESKSAAEPAGQSTGSAKPAAHKSPDIARLSTAVLDDTASALDFFQQAAGVPYSADTYTTVFAHGPVMQEVRRFSLLPDSYLAALDKDPADLWLLAHELAHQWWGIAMSARNWSDFWLNEGVATFMADAFLEKRFGRQRYQTEMDRSRKIFSEAVSSSTSRPLYFSQWTIPQEAGGPIPYHKGALFLDALRSRLGDPLFWRSFKKFTKTYMGQSVTSHQMQASFERSCHCSLAGLFGEWVYL